MKYAPSLSRCFYPLCLAGILQIGTWNLAHAQFQNWDKQEDVVIETRDGWLVAGAIMETTSGILQLKTVYGDLHIPMNQILRVNGDRFDPERGIIRESIGTMDAEGNVILESLIPIRYRPESALVQILVLGTIIDVKDIQGRSLPFMTNEIGDVSRCSVTLPDYRLPALRVKVLQKGVVKIEKQKMTYTYGYTPNIDQIFHFQLTLPKAVTKVQASPDCIRRSTDTVEWELPLTRQEDAAIQISFQLPPN